LYPKDYTERLLDFKSIIEFSSEYNSISGFLDDIITQTVITNKMSSDKEKPLILSTIHQAKGLEFQVVYLINLVNGRMPSAQIFGDYGGEMDIYQLEEERRLFYVAATRAKTHLYLTHPLYVNLQGNRGIPVGSMFIEEIQGKNVFDEGILEDANQEEIGWVSGWDMYKKDKE
jgi:DNA helicase-2/ATP-dependent DNA helicase PcrA